MTHLPLMYICMFLIRHMLKLQHGSAEQQQQQQRQQLSNGMEDKVSFKKMRERTRKLLM